MAPASRTSKATAKKATATKTADQKVAAKHASSNGAGSRSVTKAEATKSATKAPAKKAPAKKAPAKKANAKAPAKKAATTKAAAKKAVASKAPTRKVAAKAPAKKAPAEETGAKKKASGRKRSPFSASFLARQKELLVEERATYTHQADTLQAEADELVADFVSGDSQFDEDGGEGDTLSSERERDLALSAQARAAIEEIDHALSKFDLGTYGICEVSGDPIPKERLEAIPWARVQVQYKAGGIGRL